MADIVIFGTGDIAQIANYYFDIDSNHQVAAFTVDREYIDSDTFEGKPVVPYDEVANHYPPEEYGMFVALSYSKMNRIRRDKCESAKQKGYTLVSYISSNATWLSQYPHGENCFIFEDNTIQPFVKIGDNVTMWSGNHIGHHSVIGDHNFISSHVVISGHCEIKDHCFLGVNATLHDHVVIESETLVAAGAIMGKSSDPKGVYLPPRSNKFKKNSDEIGF